MTFKRFQDTDTFRLSERNKPFWDIEPKIYPDLMEPQQKCSEGEKIFLGLTKGLLSGIKAPPYCDTAEDYWRHLSYVKSGLGIIEVKPEDNVNLYIMKKEGDKVRRIKLAENIPALIKEGEKRDAVKTGLILIGDYLYITSGVLKENGEKMMFVERKFEEGKEPYETNAADNLRHIMYPGVKKISQGC